MSLLRQGSTLTASNPPLLENFEPFTLKIVWVKPEVRVIVEFKEFTHKGHLRTTSFKGIADEKI